jgi:hypothetical protein
MLRGHGAQVAYIDLSGSFDGYTESWLEASYPVSTLAELMVAVERESIED